MARFFMDTSLLGTNTAQKYETCDKCKRGFLTVVEFDTDVVFCSNALCDVNYVKSHFLDFRKREVNKK